MKAQTQAQKTFLVFLFVVTAASRTSAKPNSQTFQKPCAEVFSAAEQLATQKPYRILLDGKTDMNLIVELGSTKPNIIVQFHENSGACTVTEEAQEWTGVRNLGKKFLDRLAEKLK